MGALDGLNVVDLSRLLPGPFCTALLADHGANVTVVEAPRFKDDNVLGDVPMVRRNKRHIALDLTGDEGKEIFFKLIDEADVLVEGFRPGAADRLGVGYDAVSACNPKIVYCSLTGYGQTGPLVNRAGHDLNYMAISGLLDLNRDSERRPIMPNFQMADLSGSLYAALGVLMAVIARQRSGKGQYIDVSMTDGLVSLMPVALSFTFSGSRFPGRVHNDSPLWFPCYRIYETKDERHISVGPLEPHLWRHLCEKLGCPEYADLQYDESRLEEIAQYLDGLFRTRTLSEWMEFLDEPNDCVAPVNLVSELPHQKQLRSRGMINFSEGGIPEPGITPQLLGTPGAISRPPYGFGEHTREILEELGYDGDHIRELEGTGVVWSP